MPLPLVSLSLLAYNVPHHRNALGEGSGDDPADEDLDDLAKTAAAAEQPPPKQLSNSRPAQPSKSAIILNPTNQYSAEPQHNSWLEDNLRAPLLAQADKAKQLVRQTIMEEGGCRVRRY